MICVVGYLYGAAMWLLMRSVGSIVEKVEEYFDLFYDIIYFYQLTFILSDRFSMFAQHFLSSPILSAEI